MAEQRQFSHSVCVKIDAKTEAKFELFPAEQWDGGSPGCFRVRRNRSWLEAVGEKHLFLSAERIGMLISEVIAGQESDLREPLMPKGSAVRVRRDPDDPYSYQRVYTKTDPWRSWDGHWYVQVRLYGRGDIMVRIDQCEPIPAPAPRVESTEE